MLFRSPILFYLARDAALGSHWLLMWERAGEAVACALLGIAILWSVMDGVAALPRFYEHPAARGPNFRDYWTAWAAGVSVRTYRQRHYPF